MELELKTLELKVADEAGGAATTLVARVWPPWMSTNLNSYSIYLLSWRKNQRESFIVFYDTEPPPSPNLSWEG